MPRLLLGVSGGIAAYKALAWVRLATGAGHSVRVIQTPASQRFVGSASFAAITGAAVLDDEFAADPDRGAFPGQPRPDHTPLSHLAVVANADLYLIAPATANTISGLAAGRADSLLLSAALAAPCPVLVAPAMNDRMFRHPATQANLAVLRARGVGVIEPGEGRLGSPGEWGVGRLAEPADLLAACEHALAGSGAAEDLSGVRVLITAGGTREPIDGVRFVGNRSSGRMGFALAAAAADRGAEVHVLAANVDLPRRPDIRYEDVVTAEDLSRAARAAFPASDVLLMAAAVADFRPAAPVEGKIKKAGRDSLPLALEPTEDVLGALSGSRRAGQVLVGFAAEHGDGALAEARRKLADKALDAVVVNDVSRADIAFESTHNEVTIVTAAGEEPVPRAEKEVVAGAVLDAVARLRDGAQ